MIQNKIKSKTIIKFVDLPRQNKNLKNKISAVVGKIIESAQFIEGDPLVIFEKSFAKFCNKKYAIGLNSGTDALKLALIAYDIKEDDEVITTPNSYFSTAMVVSEIGAKPVFVDIDPDTYTMDTKKIEKAISKKTKAIIPVHLYGQVTNMDPILKLAKKYGLVIIEDACQAHGATYKGKIVPISETGAFSFYPGKNLGCFGDGGALVTNNYDIAKKILYLRNDGSFEKNYHEMFGIKSRLDSLQASILSLKLNYLSKWNFKRRSNAILYTELLGKISNVKIPKEANYASHVFHLYVIEVDRRDELRIYLKKSGIETGIHYPIPIHLQPPYRKLGFKEGDFPITEMKVKRILSLPMFPELRINEIKYVVKKIEDFFKF